MEFTAHKIPLFSPLNNVLLRTQYEVGDINFVSAKATNCIHQLGYTGPGFQHRVLTEHLRHFGVIVWADMSHNFTASGS